MHYQNLLNSLCPKKTRPTNKSIFSHKVTKDYEQPKNRFLAVENKKAAFQIALVNQEMHTLDAFGDSVNGKCIGQSLIGWNLGAAFVFILDNFYQNCLGCLQLIWIMKIY
jgi:hypothetical protein